VNYKRTRASDLKNQLIVDGNEIKMPSICDLLKTPANCEGKVITQQVINNLIRVYFMLTSKWEIRSFI
jgi:hypothetical protein